MQLDVPTVITIDIASAALTGVILGFARDARAVPGFREATASAWFTTGAFCLHVLRGKMPAMLPFGVVNALLWPAILLQMRAFERFDGRRAPARWPWTAALVAFVVFMTLVFTGASYVVRATFTSCVIGSISAASVWALTRDDGLSRERSRWICVALCCLVSFCMIVRIVVLFTLPADDDMLRPSLDRSIALFPSVFYALGFGLGFLEMHRERSQAQLRALALTDAVTDCGNRRALGERAKSEIAHSVRTRRPIAVIVTDIDRFKVVNDTHGHSVGDEVLRHFVGVLKRGTRASDFVARYGGEEFCVLLRDADARAAAMLAERLRAALRAAPVVTSAGAIDVTASFGVAEFDSSAAESWDALFLRADAALYRAKHGGRDRVEVDEPKGSVASPTAHALG